MSEVATSKAYHQDARRFHDALTHTASETGFSARLIEKDYFCSILLEDLGAMQHRPALGILRREHQPWLGLQVASHPAARPDRHPCDASRATLWPAR